ncbi:exonuclease family protein, partial [Chlamydia psittaci 06-1683]
TGPTYLNTIYNISVKCTGLPKTKHTEL